MDIDVGYAHLFVEEPRSEFTDSQGHSLIGTYDASVDIISAAVTFRWGGPKHVSEGYAKDSKGISAKNGKELHLKWAVTTGNQRRAGRDKVGVDELFAPVGH